MAVRRRHDNLTEIPAISPKGMRFAYAKLAQEKNLSVYCIVLAWLRSKSPCILPIPGASKISSVEDSVQAVEIKLSVDEIKIIDKETS